MSLSHCLTTKTARIIIVQSELKRDLQKADCLSHDMHSFLTKLPFFFVLKPDAACAISGLILFRQHSFQSVAFASVGELPVPKNRHQRQRRKNAYVRLRSKDLRAFKPPLSLPKNSSQIFKERLSWREVKQAYLAWISLLNRYR